MYAENTTIEDKTIYLDGATIHNCNLKNCKLVYSGLIAYSLTNSTFDSCTWAFNGPAYNTLAFLRSVSQSGAREMVENVTKALLEDGEIPGTPES